MRYDLKKSHEVPCADDCTNDECRCFCHQSHDLPEIMAGMIFTMEECPEFQAATVDDFYDFVGISVEDRTDFATNCLQEQTLVLLHNAE